MTASCPAPSAVCARRRLTAGYKGVCIAPGGRLALRYVEEKRPRAIVAVACDKELAAGVSGVKEVSAKGMPLPSMIVIPLARDGCVDCEVDEEEAIRMIRLGCRRLRDAAAERRARLSVPNPSSAHLLLLAPASAPCNVLLVT